MDKLFHAQRSRHDRELKFILLISAPLLSMKLIQSRFHNSIYLFVRDIGIISFFFLQLGKFLNEFHLKKDATMNCIEFRDLYKGESVTSNTS